jgi:hypothetical protein
MDGGRNSAKGFRYQYLRTLEALMSAAEESNEIAAAVHIEGLPAADGVGAESIDYEVSDSSGRVLEAVQVKARAARVAMGAGQVFEALARLVTTRDATSYALLTTATEGRSATQLLAALDSKLNAEELREVIEAVLGSGRQKDLLAQLTDEQLARLHRARVEFDSRDNAEISDGLRSRLRLYRDRSRARLGSESAGLLIGFLLSEVFRRAEQATEATVKIAYFRSLLLTDGATLAQVLGRRDWGVVVGPLPTLPDVRRTEILGRLQEQLPVGGHGVGVARCLLTGMSGIGKTSLAVGYLLERADIYDVVFWAEAESEQTLASSFSRIYRYLRGDEAIVPAELALLRDTVLTDLSCTSGRWLLVVDGCPDIRDADQWIPRIGTGHVIVTSTDSAVPPGANVLLEVPGMMPTEAAEMLHRRLSPHVELNGRQLGKLARLARELEYWPLALELASAYLHGTGLGLEGIPEYLKQLKLRSLGDTASVPLGYPRTLLQAIRLNLQPIIEAADSPQSPDTWAAVYALETLRISAYMASRQIPIYLVISIIAIEIEPNFMREHPRPILLDDAFHPPAEVIRMLRTQSLVNADEPLPPDGSNDVAYDYTISVNSVLQEVIRALFDGDMITGQAIDRLAWHSERWMKASIELGALEKTLILAAHVSAIEQHARRLGAQTDIIEYLRGNLASVLFRQNMKDPAARMLRSEISWFRGREEEHAKFLTCQASLQLAGVLSEYGPSALDEITTLLETAYFSLREFADRADNHISLLAVEVLSTLRSLQRTYTTSDRLTMLTEVVEDLVDRLPESQLSKIARSFSKIADCMSNHRDISLAIELSRPLLQELTDANVHEAMQIRRHARKLYIEALTVEGDVAEAIAELDRFSDDTRPPTLFVREIEELVHNVGYICMLQCLSGATEEAGLLARLLADGRAELIDRHFSGVENLRLDLLRGANALNNGDLDTAWRYVSGFTDRYIEPEDILKRGYGWDQAADWLAGSTVAEKGKAAGFPIPIARSNPHTGTGRFLRLRAGDRMRLLQYPVELLPLYAALAIISVQITGAPSDRCVPLCFQLQGALEYLGFSSRVITAAAMLITPEPENIEYIGVHDSPVMKKDGSTNGHVILWAPPFQRLVDPTIFLAQLIQGSAEYRTAHPPPAIMSIPEDGIVPENAVLQTATKAGVGMRWRLYPQWNESVIPQPGSDLETGLIYSKLALAHITVEIIQGLEGFRSDLDDLRNLYPQLGELIEGRRQLPSLPDKPPAEFTRLWVRDKP